MKKSLIALSVLAATSAFAGGGAGTLNNVQVAQNGIGDLLIAPVFMANGGWTSELKLVNNSFVFSTAAKVVFHRASDSAEVLDFFVYLSPGDTWSGVVTYTGGANGILSVNTITGYNSQGAANTAVAEDSTPQFTGGTITAIAGTDVGYIVVHQNAAWNLGGGGNPNATPVAKATIVAQLNADVAANVTYVENANRAVGQVSTENIISGTLRLANGLSGATATLPLVAIANYNNRKPLTLAGLTLIGNDQPGNASSSYTTLAAFEDAIWSNDFAFPYNHAQAASTGSVTFPSRHTFDRSDAHGVTFGRYPFRNIAPVQVPATIAIRDTFENTVTGQQVVVSPVPASVRPSFPELGFFTLVPNSVATNLAAGQISTNAGAGWVNLNLDGVANLGSNAVGSGSQVALNLPNQLLAGAGSTTLPAAGQNALVSGAPAITTQLNVSNAGNNLRLEWFYPAFKTVSGARGNN